MNPCNLFAVIIAGGKGERFWPQSRLSNPKPLLRLVGDLTLIEQTVERLEPLFKPSNILVVTNKDYAAPMRSLLSSIPPENIISEPVGRDTAACVALGAAVVSARAGGGEDPVLVVLPADHIITDNEKFLEVLSDAAGMAMKGKIVTIGIKPTSPSTGYGYIHCGEKIQHGFKTVFYQSLGFKEKPDSETAEKFLKDGAYRWNGGMFVWTVSSLVNEMKKHAPSLARAYQAFRKAELEKNLDKAMAQLYPELEMKSIDYALMEKAENVVVAESTFGWDDVGCWIALRGQITPSENDNVVRGLHFGLDTKNCIIVGDSCRLMATMDISDLIIIHTDDVTLVCHTKSAQRIKELVQKLSSNPELSRFL